MSRRHRGFTGGSKKKIRLLVLEAQGWICAGCGLPIKKSGGVERGVGSADHAYPRVAQSWRGHIGNLLGMHNFPCNIQKGDRMPTGCELIWLAAVNARLGWELRERPHDDPEQQAAEYARHTARQRAARNGGVPSAEAMPS